MNDEELKIDYDINEMEKKFPVFAEMRDHLEKGYEIEGRLIQCMREHFFDPYVPFDQSHYFFSNYAKFYKENDERHSLRTQIMTASDSLMESRNRLEEKLKTRGYSSITDFIECVVEEIKRTKSHK